MIRQQYVFPIKSIILLNYENYYKQYNDEYLKMNIVQHFNYFFIIQKNPKIMSMIYLSFVPNTSFLKNKYYFNNTT